MSLGHLIILLQSYKFNIATVLVKRSIRLIHTTVFEFARLFSRIWIDRQPLQLSQVKPTPEILLMNLFFKSSSIGCIHLCIPACIMNTCKVLMYVLQAILCIKIF